MKISVITINYNNRAGLEATAESVACQSGADYEWIVIDGGSTDGSVDVIKKHESRISYWCSCPDNGIYHAMNKGVKQASGEYCIFMNSGDCFAAPTVLKEISGEAEQCGCDFITGRVVWVEEKGNKTILPPLHISGRFLFKDTLNHQSTLIRTSLLRKNPYHEEYKIVSDWVFFFDELVLHGASYRPIDTVVCLFDTQGISMVNYWKTREEKAKAAKALLGEVVYDDYYRLCWGKTTLEKVVRCVEDVPCLYKLLTCLSLFVFALYKIRALLLKPFS